MAAAVDAVDGAGAAVLFSAVFILDMSLQREQQEKHFRSRLRVDLQRWPFFRAVMTTLRSKGADRHLFQMAIGPAGTWEGNQSQCHGLSTSDAAPSSEIERPHRFECLESKPSP